MNDFGLIAMALWMLTAVGALITGALAQRRDQDPPQRTGVHRPLAQRGSGRGFQ